MISSVIGALKRNRRLYEFGRYQLYAPLRSALRRQIFTTYYRDKLWDSPESASGPGSTLAATENVRRELPELLSAFHIQSLLDLPCGDLVWMRHVSLGPVKYIGGDLVPEIIDANRTNYGSFGEFEVLDLLKDRLPKTDAILCRDCLNHLSNAEIRSAVRNMKRTGAKFLIATHYPQCPGNTDTVTPYWRHINFELAPFHFPAPLRQFHDCEDKSLAVWNLSEIDA